MLTHIKDEEALRACLLKEFHWLHRHPELSYEEYETTAHIRKALEDADIRILDLPLETGLVAEIGEGDPIIALRADIDALPIEEQTDLSYRSKTKGRMHACGHDFHATSVLGAALLLKARESALQGRVRFFFQPAEEAPGGAKVVMETGALDGVSAIFGLHASPLLEVGTLGLSAGAVMASVDRFVLRFTGKGAHAAHPDLGRDPIPVAAAFIQAVQTVVSRNIDPFHAALVSVTHVEAGNTWNVIPETALVEGTTRSLSAEDRRRIRTRVTAIAGGLAKAHDMTVDTDWYEGPPATVNTAEWIDVAEGIAKDAGLHTVPAPRSLGGEDFAYYLEEVPGAFILVGTGLSASIHNPKFQVDTSALLPTARYLSALVETALKKAGSR